MARQICTTRVPIDQCDWLETKYRFFTYGPIEDQIFTGDIEITLTNSEGETWECHGGKHTAEADASGGTIQYGDFPVLDNFFVEDFGYYWIVWDESTTQSHYTEDNYDYNGFNLVFGNGSVSSPFRYYPYIDSWENQYNTGSYNIYG